MIMTKKIYLIIVLLISITFCNAQCKKLYETESVETIVSSRKKRIDSWNYLEKMLLRYYTLWRIAIII